LILNAVALWALLAGSGTTIAADVGGPSFQSFGNSGGWYPDTDGLGYGYKVQYLAAPNATGSALVTGLSGAQKIVVGLVFRTGSTLPTTGEVLAAIGADEDPSPANSIISIWCGGSGSDVRVNWNGTQVYSGTSITMSTNTLYRVWVIIDTTAAEGSRVRMIWQGADAGGTSSGVTLNSTPAFTSGKDEAIMGVPFGMGTQSAAGYDHWLGYFTWSGTYDASVILAADAVLAADNDDTDPFAGGGGPTYAELAATFAGSGSFVGALTGSAALAATFAGAMTTTASLVGFSSLTAAFSGSGTASANLTGSSALTAAFAGSSSAAGALTGLAGLSATFGGSSTFGAALVGSAALSATFAGSSALAGDLALGAVAELSGTFAGGSSFTGTTTGTASLSSTFAGSSTYVVTLTGSAQPRSSLRRSPVARASLATCAPRARSPVRSTAPRRSRARLRGARRSPLRSPDRARSSATCA
jgi:hypothetical protein